MTAADTIYALSTARGRGAVAIIRISGAMAGTVLSSLSGRPCPPPRQAALRVIHDGAEVIDRALAMWFPAPGSFTGEDVAEFHLHGGPAVIAAVLAVLARIDGCRLAEPGEFTRRGFENGQFDLTAAEAIGDLVNAETASQRRQALDQMGGVFALAVKRWADLLTRALAHVEAAIDFTDDDLPGDIAAPAIALAQGLRDDIARHLADNRRGEITRDGLSVAIIGPPNSGKSSLLNALVRRDAAIVSAIAGTTRDVIEVHLDLAGYAVTLADTAGVHDSSDLIEQEGIRRALARAEAADLRLLVLDATLPTQLEAFAGHLGPQTILVWNKGDLDTPPLGQDALTVSARTGDGLDVLEARLAQWAAARLAGPPVLVTRQRHRAALEACLAALDRVFHVKQQDFAIDLIAEDLRVALRALGRITGQVNVEDLLDVIFRDFCIGK